MVRTFYVDESGDLGPQSKNRYFVISAVEVTGKNRIKNFLKEYLKNNSLEEIKASKLSFPERQVFLNTLTKTNDHKVHYLVLDKEQIWKRGLFEDKNTLFNYMCGFLFEEIFNGNTEDICIFFDDRTVKVTTQHNLQNYLRLRIEKEQYPFKLQHLSYNDSKQIRLIQLADFYANTIFQRYKYGKTNLYKSINIATSVKFPRKNFGQ